MPLSAGSRLGSYEITGALGVGGMGEVWRARDTRLGREVAIKVLPGDFLESEERKTRFEREARALAALNHPGIAAIYSFEEISGRHLLVMELAEGETLADRVSRGPLPLEESLSLARQIAEALEAAHDKGIVHRDLKPSNVKVSAEGKVKLLDFGLAKALEGERDSSNGGSDGGLTQSPTVTARATAAGVILGTAAYMSPEQARGKAVDKRTDIWAFGCVLYEMLAGRRCFEGDTVSDILAALLKTDPDWRALPADVPASIRGLLRRCLARETRRRLQAIGEARIALEDAIGSPAPGAEAMAPGRARVPRALAWSAVTVGAAVVAFAVGRLLVHRGPATASRSPTGTFLRLTDFPGVEREPNLSPDGQTVLYVSAASGNDDIYALRIGGHNPIDLTADSPARDASPAFSPDGSRIAFRSERGGGGIFVMGATGESVRRVADFGFNPSWSPGAKEIVVATGSFEDPFSRGQTSALYAVDLLTGMRRLVCTGDAVQPAWSPHGDRIAYWGIQGATGQRDLWTVAADGSEAKGRGIEVTSDAALDWSPVWSPSGREIYFLSDRGGTMNLWRVPIDERSGRPGGEPEPVTAPAAWVSGFSLSKDERRLVYAVLDHKSTIESVAFDPVAGAAVGSPQAVLRGARIVSSLDWSPDGLRLVFGTLGSSENLYTIASDGSGYRQLTDDGYRKRGPRWAPDGRTIAYLSNRAGRYALWSMNPEGGGLRSVSEVGGLPVWSPDGRRLACGPGSGQHGAVIIESGASPPASTAVPSPGEDLLFYPSDWGPDGRSLVGVCSPLTMAPGEIYTYSIDQRTFRDLKVRGFNPAWLPDGRRLLFARDGAVSLLDTATGTVRDVLPRGSVPEGVWQKFALSRDGRKLAFIEPYEDGDLWMLSLPPAEAQRSADRVK